MILEKLFLSFACGLATSSGVLWVRVRVAISEEDILACGELCENEPFDTSKGLGIAGFSGFDLQDEVSPNTVCG